MSVLNSFAADLNVAVIGASGGIGAEFVRQLAGDGRVTRVHALARQTAGILDDKIVVTLIDIGNEESVAAGADAAGREPLDLVIVATGVLHRDASLQPEKSLADIDAVAMTEVLRVNAVGPALVAKHFLPKLRRDGKTVFAALSARIGSIGDNRLGGWFSYRASKSALNMILKSLSIEHARRFPESIVVGLHPGTVNTQLSAPFQRRVPADKLFTPAQSVSYMLAVINHLAPADTGRVFAWDGTPIEN